MTIRRLAKMLALTGLLVAGPGAAQQATEASGAVLRGLDKVSGATTDLTLRRGEIKVFGKLAIALGDCRYPAEDRSSDAWAELEITDLTQEKVVFSGWMIASSPALSALDHPRYDVWVLHCTTS